MKRTVIAILICFSFLLGACTTITGTAEQKNPLKIWGENKNGAYNTLKVVDENTGVNYVVVSSSHGCAITPRLNSDGSLYVE